ncbi:hypothetical protein [Nonomuraea sp. NPDC001023]|uniref:hypothetical protein n=1 Tax=unclassified Nonomuraea TaxID=2593643 RepID=UPI00333149E0
MTITIAPTDIHNTPADDTRDRCPARWSHASVSASWNLECSLPPHSGLHWDETHRRHWSD